MKQMPRFLKYLTLVVSFASMLIPAARLVHLNSNELIQEGYHPKNVNLAGPLAITCMDPKTYYVGANCLVEIIDTVPTSTTNITYLSYSIKGGPVVILMSPYPTVLNAGMYGVDSFNIVWEVRDMNNAMATCTHTKIIKDTIPPTPMCKDVTVDLNNTGDTILMASILNNGSTDNCGGPITFSTIPPSLYFACNDVDTSPNQVTLIVTDSSGNTATCISNITIRDLILPTISCPANITVNVNPGQCFATNANLGQPVTNDNCLPVKDTLRRFNGDTLKTNTQLPVGDNTIIWIVTDKHNNTNSCSQLVTVRDNEVPVINCPSDMTIDATTGNCAASASYTTPVGTDNCPGATTMQTTGLASGASFPIGVTTNTFKVTDAAGNTATCSFNITVRDMELPSISCPANITMNADPGTCAANVTYTAPVGTDLCSGASTMQTSGLPSGGSFPVGVTPNIFRVTDASGNTATCSFTITVVDNQLPLITCPSDITMDAQIGSCSATVSYTPPVGTDNCPGANTTLTGGLASGAVFPIGMTINTFTVTAANGATATCSFTVTVRDIELPSINCLADITVNAINSTCAANVTYTAPIGTDLCPGATTMQTSGFASGASFPVGMTTNTFKVTDAFGNTATCSFTVTVRDVELPSISCPSDITVNAANGTCAADVIYTAPVGTDNCPGASTMQTAGFVSGASFPVGVTSNTFKVTDAAGNTATCSFTVTVRDVQLPSISCPSDITMNAAMGTCAANVTYTAPVGTDVCLGASTMQTSGFASGASFPVGVTSNTFKVTDASGNTATCSFTVTVADTQLPVINCPGDMTVSTQNMECSATVNFTAPVGTDNCPGAMTSLISGLAPGTVYPLGMTVNTYQVTAANGATATCSFKVTVMDMEPPTISCFLVDSVALNNNCKLLVPDLRFKITVGDNCGIYTLIQSPSPGSIVASSHNQVHIFTFTVTDLGGLSASCTTSVVARDSLGPDIVCQSKTVLPISSNVTLPAYIFVNSAADSCGGPITYQVRRMSSNTFQDSINFTCADVNDTIMVIIRVSDARGNFTECMDSVIVKDNIAPMISAPLPDITVSCEFPLDTNNLSVFGTYEHVDSIRKNIFINDPGNPFYPMAGLAGQNGVFTENCPESTVNVRKRTMLTMCNTGQIKRDFIITDVSGNTTTSTQTIYVVDIHKFNITDIIWPPPVVDYYNCTDLVPDTSKTKSPGVINHKCSQAGVSFIDQVGVNPNFCKSINRTWTVIDWCQYVKNTPNSPGKWTFDQLIVIRDTVAPRINTDVCRDTVICAPLNNCNATVTFRAAGTDNCTPVLSWTYKIDLDNNGGIPDVTGMGSSFTKLYSLGTHKLTWEAKDECGNVATCSFLFTIKDCKAPNAIAMQRLATNIMPGMGMAIMKASDFNNFSSDNCTPSNKLRYSFSTKVNDTLRTYNCDSLGKRVVEMWVTDMANNQTKAITFVSVQDNQNACGNANKINISGTIYTENRTYIPGTKVKIDGGETEGEYVTDKTGKYIFKDLAMFNDYQILPEKNTGHMDGITTLDLVIIQRHILGLKTLESPFKIIAADINNSQSVTAADLVELRKMVLGIQTEFTNNTSWRFVDALYKFNDLVYPWPYAENLHYEGLEKNMTQSDFIGVKIGDVNGSATANLSQQTGARTSKLFKINIDETNVRAGEIIAVPVYAENMNGITGVQWTIEVLPGLTFSGYEAAKMELKDENMAVISKNGKQYLTLSYNSQKTESSEEETMLFNLIFTVDKSASLSHLLKFSGEITPALAITNEDQEENIVFAYRTKEIDQAEYIYQNQPNPFKNETQIQLGLKKVTTVNITIYDAKGSAIYSGNESLGAGKQIISINDKHLGNQFGVFYCRIKANNINQIVKMLRIE
ncbi:MAG: HYR domain-containing protein [Saprospiraceae bacterium]|nr:HYR domain-containing protein [Saprospiraceae bacterium]